MVVYFRLGRWDVDLRLGLLLLEESSVRLSKSWIASSELQIRRHVLVVLSRCLLLYVDWRQERTLCLGHLKHLLLAHLVVELLNRIVLTCKNLLDRGIYT